MSRLRDLRNQIETRVGQLRETAGPLLERAEPLLAVGRRVVGPVTGLGWTIAGIGVVTWWFGVRLGWEELLIVAAACLLAFVISLLSTLGRPSLDVDVDVEPGRIVVGGDAVGSVQATNSRERTSLGGRIECPVGKGVASFDVGRLGAGEQWDDLFVVPTQKRAVIPIGPARTVKGDPLGIARREAVSGEATQLYVHPYTVRLPSFTAGWLRDLEGQTTNDLSTSDVAFHTLREYVPGDDRRHIHWRTSARLGTLMVRQFVDTRRSHLGLVLSTTATDWADEDEFELGVSVLGSIGRTALTEEQEVTAISGEHPIAAPTPPVFLDGLSGVDRDAAGPDLRGLVLRSLTFLNSASVVAMVVGSTVDPRALRAACEHYGQDIPVLAFQIRPGADAKRLHAGHTTLLDIGSIDDLGRILHVVGV